LISHLKPHQIAAKGIARTFQNIRLFGELSALENVIVGRHLHTKSNFVTGILGLPQANQAEKQAKQKAHELIELVGLGDRLSEKAKNLSYGDQRRLEIARALALEPSILLLDEPAAGMNPNEKQVLSTFIRDLRTQFNLTIILIEHHVPLVMGLCDRIAVLNFGKLIALGQPEIVRNDPAVIEAYLGVD
ncbi:MAG: ABC transporter ATP-binding protein, partial [Snowella sp.]